MSLIKGGIIPNRPVLALFEQGAGRSSRIWVDVDDVDMGPPRTGEGPQGLIDDKPPSPRTPNSQSVPYRTA